MTPDSSPNLESVFEAGAIAQSPCLALLEGTEYIWRVPDFVLCNGP